MSAKNLSIYAESLSEEAKTRYKGKLNMIDGFDPFSGTAGELADRSPPVEPADIVLHLVLQTSFITAKQFKARKSLEAYDQFVNDWVKEVCNRKVAGKFVVTGRVSDICCLLVIFNLLQKHGCVNSKQDIQFIIYSTGPTLSENE